MASAALKIPRYPNRLAELRKTRGWTQQEVAERAGMLQQTYQRYERGQRRIKADQLTLFAGIFGVEKDEVTGDGAATLVTILGLVEPAGNIDTFASHQSAPPHTACPRGLDPRQTLAVRIGKDAELPFVDRDWVLFFEAVDGDLDNAVGELCLVTLKNEQMKLRRMQRGVAPGRWLLVHPISGRAEDGEIKTAAVMRAMVAPGVAGRA